LGSFSGFPRHTDTPVPRFVRSLFPSLFPAFPSVGTGHEGQVHKPAARFLAFTPFRFAVALFFFAVRVHGYLRSGTWVPDSRFKIQKKNRYPKYLQFKSLSAHIES
jgi:hypothetical protein